MEKFSIGLGFTSNCNMNCPFCYSKDKRSENQECSFDEWINFIDNNHMYVRDINYGTSENATSMEWYNFISYIRKNYPSIRQAVTTNGSLGHMAKSDENKKFIIDRCIDEIDVSIDYGNSELHNYFRGNENAFAYAIETLEFCRQYGKKATIVMLGIDDTLMESNLENIFFLAEKYNAVVRVNIYRPVNPSSKIKTLSFKRINWLFGWMEKNHRILSVSDPLFSSVYFENYIRHDPSGISSIRILQNGDIFPSTYLLDNEVGMGNIADTLLENIKKGKIYQLICNLDIPRECETCIYKKTCRGGVLDRRYLWYGKFSCRDPYCPFRMENRDYYSGQAKCHVSKEIFYSVHDGYLPTLFFGV